MMLTRVNTGSGYERIDGDNYVTPPWVTKLLPTVEKFEGWVLEAAPGEGHMVRDLREAGLQVTQRAGDFLEITTPWQNIITNPPFSLADEFVRHALELTRPLRGKVAMLLPHEWDCAKKRVDIFRDCQAFKAKYVITKRISWANLEHTSSPKKHHAFYVWDWRWGQKWPRMGWL